LIVDYENYRIGLKLKNYSKHKYDNFDMNSESKFIDYDEIES